jgi:hypothetical protein
LNETGAPTGYGDAAYAASLSEFGSPRLLPRSGGWLLQRPIPGSDRCDAMGCYPFFACQDWRGLAADIEEIDDLVCLSLVTDPFGAYDEDDLRLCFTQVTPYKQHFVTELGRPVEAIVSKHHRYYARKALERVTVERCNEPKYFLDQWTELYEHLSVRRALKGIQAFSRSAFETQLAIPGVVMLRATYEDRTVAAHLWYAQAEVMQSHLAAANELGYGLMASYALYWFALQTFAGEACWLNLGAGAGLESQGSEGLARFKRGWATGTRTAYFCGRIFEHQMYRQLVKARGITQGAYFPLYRQGEFG